MRKKENASGKTVKVGSNSWHCWSGWRLESTIPKPKQDAEDEKEDEYLIAEVRKT